MRIRDRLRRVWRWAAVLLDASPPTPASAVRTRVVPPPPPLRAPLPPSPGPAPDGHVVVDGPVSVRLWSVGAMVVLATDQAQAERAVSMLLGHGDPGVRREAGRLLEELRGERAAA